MSNWLNLAKLSSKYTITALLLLILSFSCHSGDLALEIERPGSPVPPCFQQKKRTRKKTIPYVPHSKGFALQQSALIGIAKRNGIAEMKHLQRQGISIIAEEPGRYPRISTFTVAADEGYIPLANLIIKTMPQERQEEELSEAITFGYEKRLFTLFQSPYFSAQLISRALSMGAQLGSASTVKLLLDFDLPDSPETPALVAASQESFEEEEKDTPLYLLLKTNKPIKKDSETIRKAMNIAVEKCIPRYIQLLLDNGFVDSEDNPIISQALRAQKGDSIPYLWEHPNVLKTPVIIRTMVSELNEPHSELMSDLMIELYDQIPLAFRVLASLFDNGLDPHYATEDGISLLSLAVSMGPKILKLVLDRGGQDTEDFPAIAVAATVSNLDSFRYALLEPRCMKSKEIFAKVRKHLFELGAQKADPFHEALIKYSKTH